MEFLKAQHKTYQGIHHGVPELIGEAPPPEHLQAPRDADKAQQPCPERKVKVHGG